MNDPPDRQSIRFGGFIFTLARSGALLLTTGNRQEAADSDARHGH
jgi:hypothetical protein